MEGVLSRFGTFVLGAAIALVALHAVFVSLGMLTDQPHYPIFYTILLVPAFGIWLLCKAVIWIFDLH